MKFDPFATTFNLENALYLANICKIVNKGYSEIEKDVELLELKYKFFDKENIQALILYDENKVIITFRGTEPENIMDWITNIDCRKIKCSYARGLVHGGFERGITKLWEYLHYYLMEIKSNVQNKRIWLCGHSQGGALVTLLPCCLKYNGILQEYDIGGGYTYGSPRVGDETFAREFTNNFGDKWYRFVNCNDYITRIPRRIFHYKHVPLIGDEELCYYFDENGKLYSPNQSHEFWDKFWDKIEGGFNGICHLKLAMIEHHILNNYIKNIALNLEKD